ncbi:hypothetical protein [Arthrobacter sp. ISL-69]|uniref:hypothetical protein n=1 Tax=Arthrobacter sp. ISL-69 TaxID=2819113 RepID=UPI001BEB316E|nr:hypothetical protein [Arthrobacter sp. ISL-69]MBT2537208.1 hypothetical protein [Arthrobacter sp. ISL-69]
MTMEPIICACGTEKDVVHLIAVCGHCDQPCTDRAGCVPCGTFTLATRKRVDAEYKAEKSGG